MNSFLNDILIAPIFIIGCIPSMILVMFIYRYILKQFPKHPPDAVEGMFLWFFLALLGLCFYRLAA